MTDLQVAWSAAASVYVLGAFLSSSYHASLRAQKAVEPSWLAQWLLVILWPLWSLTAIGFHVVTFCSQWRKNYMEL